MGSIKSFLSVDHKDCDEAFADMENAVVANKWSDANDLFTKMLKMFIRHFEMEEEIMFPEFEECSGMSCGPTQVMRMEHEQMRQALNKLEQALKVENRSDALGVCETFNILVQQHNSKEEMILYTMADNVLFSKSEEMVERMKAIA